MPLRLDPNSALDHLPQPLVIVTAGDFEKPGQRGGMTAAWVSRVSMSPPLIMVSIAPSRYTLELVREHGEFAVNIVGRRLEKAAYSIFGSRTGRGMDKIAESGVKARKGGKTRAPILEDATVSLECRLVKTVEAGDHVLVVGEVVNAFKFSDEQPLVLTPGGSR